MLIHVPPQVAVLAMDVHKNTISTGLLEAGSTSPVLDKISTDDESVRRLISRFEDPPGCGPATRLAPPATSWPEC